MRAYTLEQALERIKSMNAEVSNPKQLSGDKKVAVQRVPPVALVYLGLAFGDGANKYGPFNWRETRVESTTYYGAAMRHLAAWYDGENIDPDSGNPHIAHAMACLAMIADSYEGGFLEDNRPSPGPTSKVLERYSRKEEFYDPGH